MKRLVVLLLGVVSCLSIKAQTTQNAAEHKTRYLSTSEFKESVFDYTASKEWKFKGIRPCVIDFYATWCGPCKMVAPILESLAADYDGKIDIYKVDVDKEKELAAVFGVRSIPTMLWVPMDEQPSLTQGAMQKEALTELIDVLLLGQKPKNLKMWQSEETAE
ncbi:MAG: thioredoxin [Bacteroidales bacterium]|nr:thioredoxin [Bacteroidales bacterium]